MITDRGTSRSSDDGQTVGVVQTTVYVTSITTSVSNKKEPFAHPLINGMQKIQSGWLRDFEEPSVTIDEIDANIDTRTNYIMNNINSITILTVNNIIIIIIIYYCSH